MKQCAVCALSIEHINEPAILFIGRYGYCYELCPECEKAVERFISPESEDDRREAADIVYDRFFRINTDRKSAELLDYMKSLFNENGSTLAEAQEALRLFKEESELAEEETDEENAAEKNDGKLVNEDTPTEDTEEDEISEEEFLADTAKKTPLGLKLLFLLLFLAIGGGAIAYGVWQSSTFSTVAGAIVALLGIASVCTKD